MRERWTERENVGEGIDSHRGTSKYNKGETGLSSVLVIYIFCTKSKIFD